MIDRIIIATDTQWSLDSRLFYPYQWNKGTPYNQALKLDRICPENGSFDIVVQNVAKN